MKKIALFGGAFNPPTLGHIQVAQYVLDNSDFDQVHFLPCYSHMYNKAMVLSGHRINMCAIAAERDVRVRVNGFEKECRHTGGTHQMLLKFLKKNTENKYSMIIGEDNAITFDKWANYKELQNLISFVVVPRIGVFSVPEVQWYFKAPHMYIQGIDPPQDTSSTKVREILSELVTYPEGMPNSLQELLDSQVYSYIREFNLYK